MKTTNVKLQIGLKSSTKKYIHVGKTDIPTVLLNAGNTVL